MSYDAYKDFVRRMTEQELEAEIAKLQHCVDKAKTSQARAAWSRMVEICRAQQRHNAVARPKVS